MSTLKVDAIRHNSATSDAITTAADGTCTARITGMTGGGGLSHRNKIINGAMTVSQRATSASVSGDSNGVYKVCDRFKFRVKGGAAYTTSQSSTSPDGFSKSLKVDITTADTSLSGDDQAWVAQYIEAQDLQDLSYGTSGAQSITLSFYVRSNKTGTYFVALNQADNGYKNIGFQYTINSANTWERKSFLIPGDTSGVINDDNGTGLELYWWLAAGPTYTSGSIRSSWTTYSNGDFGAGQSINLLDSTSNEWYITGVQLEVGDTVTSYEHRSYGDELQKCQRYFQKVAYATASGSGDGTTLAAVWSRFNTPMRAGPTITVSGALNAQGDNALNSTQSSAHAGTNNYSSVQNMYLVYVQNFSGVNQGRCYTVGVIANNSNQFLASAEL